jgi:hypothetical protein
MFAKILIGWGIAVIIAAFAIRYISKRNYEKWG